MSIYILICSSAFCPVYRCTNMDQKVKKQYPKYSYFWSWHSSVTLLTVILCKFFWNHQKKIHFLKSGKQKQFFQPFSTISVSPNITLDCTGKKLKKMQQHHVYIYKYFCLFFKRQLKMFCLSKITARHLFIFHRSCAQLMLLLFNSNNKCYWRIS